MKTTPTTTTSAPIPFTTAPNEVPPNLDVLVDLVELIVQPVLQVALAGTAPAGARRPLRLGSPSGRTPATASHPDASEPHHRRQPPAERDHRHHPRERTPRVGEHVLAAEALHVGAHDLLVGRVFLGGGGEVAVGEHLQDRGPLAR